MNRRLQVEVLVNNRMNQQIGDLFHSFLNWTPTQFHGTMTPTAIGINAGKGMVEIR